jgi:membrane protease YdiL (CAAX protease family)
MRDALAPPGGGRHVPPPEVPGREAAVAAPPEVAGRDAAGPGPAPDRPQWTEQAGERTWPEQAAGRTWPEAPATGHAWPEAPAAGPGEDGGQTWPVEPAVGGHGGTGDGARVLEGPRRTRAAAPGEPFYLPRADWRWPAAVAGLLAGAAPQVLLQLASIFAGGTPSSAEPQSAAGAIGIVLASIVIYGWQALAAWLFSLRTAGRSLVLWGFRRPGRAFLWVVPLGLVAAYAVGIVHDVIVHPEQQAIVSQFPRSLVGALAFILVAVVLAPLFEEIVFRGFLFRGLANSFGWVWAALASAGIFGIAHLQLDVFVPLAALGFFLAWSYRRTGSLWAPIAMHAVFNAIAVLAWALIG